MMKFKYKQGMGTQRTGPLRKKDHKIHTKNFKIIFPKQMEKNNIKKHPKAKRMIPKSSGLIRL